VQLIGWNPQGGHVQSWNFTSDGGHASEWSGSLSRWRSDMKGCGLRAKEPAEMHGACGLATV
jgi:hypothetical protein